MNVVISSVLIKNELYKKFLYDYVISLRQSYLEDCIIFVYNELDAQILKFLSKNNIIIIQKQLTMECINNQRIIDIYNYLNNSNYNKIIITDIDIWFQEPINNLFDLIKNKFIYTSDVPLKGKFVEFPWLNIFKNKKEELESLKNLNYLISNFGTMINCGVFGAKKEILQKKLKQYVNFTDKLNKEFYGLDTLVFNSIFNNTEDEILKYKYNYLTKLKPKLQNNIFLTSDNQKINIMHIAGSSRQFPEYFYPYSIFKNEKN